MAATKCLLSLLNKHREGICRTACGCNPAIDASTSTTLQQQTQDLQNQLASSDTAMRTPASQSNAQIASYKHKSRPCSWLHSDNAPSSITQVGVAAWYDQPGDGNNATSPGSTYPLLDIKKKHMMFTSTSYPQQCRPPEILLIPWCLLMACHSASGVIFGSGHATPFLVFVFAARSSMSVATTSRTAPHRLPPSAVCYGSGSGMSTAHSAAANGRYPANLRLTGQPKQAHATWAGLYYLRWKGLHTNPT
jgi:hypothetical protein